MAQSEADICNLALVGIGHTKFINSLSEQTTEAMLCNQFYAHARDAVLSDAPWPFAQRQAPLSQIGGTAYASATAYGAQDTVTYNGVVYISLQPANTGHQPDISPTFWRQVSRNEWAYVYTRPADCVKVNSIEPAPVAAANPALPWPPGSQPITVSGVRSLRSDQDPSHELGNDATLGTLLFCDVPSAILNYTGRVTDVTLYAEEFVEAVAAELRKPLAAGLRKDKQVVQDAKAESKEARAEAAAMALQEVKRDPDPVPDFIANR